MLNDVVNCHASKTSFTVYYFYNKIHFTTQTGFSKQMKLMDLSEMPFVFEIRDCECGHWDYELLANDAVFLERNQYIQSLNTDEAIVLKNNLTAILACIDSSVKSK